ncbi:MAG: hypothetical protein ACHQ52_04125 [Candidatus Eisenbacteria bacterium]
MIGAHGMSAAARRVWGVSAVLVAAAWLAPLPTRAGTADVPLPVPIGERGTIDAERSGTHDANRIRTVFWNFGMVGDYPPDPINVDLSVFHSVEVPKGSGMNYSDGITPFVLTKIRQRNGVEDYVMETGYRERQALSPYLNRIMRFEPRPGYFEPDPGKNPARSPAISSDARTWPAIWPDKLDDPSDPGWKQSWDGYFGKRPAADQESYTVMDDDFYDAWDFYPDGTDPTRRGLGLRVEVRGFQWANPQAGNVIFWHYDITNEGTTDYNNMVFGLYMDSGVGGSAISCDGIAESDDDNAFFDKSSGLNLVYTWDRYGHGRDLAGNCSPTGYVGYAYLETPGNEFNGIDDDQDGITDESRDSGPGTKIVGQDAIRAYVVAHYDTTNFFRTYGPLERRPAYRAGVWWTGDEDMDWDINVDDVGADGVPDTHDLGEGDGIPTSGEPNFDKTDLHESDQIGLTGFKFNRIKAGVGNPNPVVDGVLFYMDQQEWPRRLYEQFTNTNPAARFDSALAANYNIAFLFASGPFRLPAKHHERFSLALAYGADLTELRSTITTVQQIYNANYQFAVPPTLPTASAETGDHRVTLNWDDVAERSVDPVTHEFDFEGYRIYRSTDPEFRDPQVISTGRGTGPIGNGAPIAQFDLVDGKRGFTRKTVEGVAYWLGTDTGLTHTWTDTTATNGQDYYYAVCAYDFGFDSPFDSLSFYPSENAITVSRTPRGGLILPRNVVHVRPDPRVAGYTRATSAKPQHIAGIGTGNVDVQVIDSNLVPENHLFGIRFTSLSPDSVHALFYTLFDSTANRTIFKFGSDFRATGAGAIGSGLLPMVLTDSIPRVDALHTGLRPGSPTNARLKVIPLPGLSPNLRRLGYPDSLTIVFSDQVLDTSIKVTGANKIIPCKFAVTAHTDTGDVRLRYAFRDAQVSGPLVGVLDDPREAIDITTTTDLPGLAGPQFTWRVQIDTTGQGSRGPLLPPSLGDVWDLKVARPFEAGELFTFSTTAQRVDAVAAKTGWQERPYVVPNPYIGSASFEPGRFAISGRGERRMEFRAIPLGSTIHIYTVHGDLVRTLRQDGSNDGFVAWDLRTKDNLDVAAGLYVFHVDAPGLGTFLGKFAVIK